VEFGGQRGKGVPTGTEFAVHDAGHVVERSWGGEQFWGDAGSGGDLKAAPEVLSVASFGADTAGAGLEGQGSGGTG